MKAKLQHLIKSEGLTASRFAEMLEIQPAGVSHILAGRNKPSFDLLQKILRRFPKINPDWLLLDSDQMYRDGWNTLGGATGGANGGGSNPSTGANFAQGSNFSVGSVNGGANGNLPFGTQNLPSGESHISGMQDIATGLSHSRAGFPVEKIVIFYADGSFEAYSPASRQG